MKNEIRKAAEAIAYTSVDDARSSLKCAEQTGKVTRESLDVLQEAIDLLKARVEAALLLKSKPSYSVTKIKLFESTLKRWRKIVSAPPQVQNCCKGCGFKILPESDVCDYCFDHTI